MSDLYAVVEFNQASGRPTNWASIWDTLDGARDERDQLAAQARRNGRGYQHRIYQLTEVVDDEGVGR